MEKSEGLISLRFKTIILKIYKLAEAYINSIRKATILGKLLISVIARQQQNQ